MADLLYYSTKDVDFLMQEAGGFAGLSNSINDLMNNPSISNVSQLSAVINQGITSTINDTQYDNVSMYAYKLNDKEHELRGSLCTSQKEHTEVLFMLNTILASGINGKEAIRQSKMMYNDIDDEPATIIYLKGLSGLFILGRKNGLNAVQMLYYKSGFPVEVAWVYVANHLKDKINGDFEGVNVPLSNILERGGIELYPSCKEALDNYIIEPEKGKAYRKGKEVNYTTKTHNTRDISEGVRKDITIRPTIKGVNISNTYNSSSILLSKVVMSCKYNINWLKTLTEQNISTDHIDGDYTNNCIHNLQLVSPKFNSVLGSPKSAHGARKMFYHMLNALRSGESFNVLQIKKNVL